MGSFRQTNWLGGIPSMRIVIQGLTSSQLTVVAPFLQLLGRCHRQYHQAQHAAWRHFFLHDPLNMVQWRLCLSRLRAHHGELQARLYGLQAGRLVRLVLSPMAPLGAGHSQGPRPVDREISRGTPRWEEASVRRRQARGPTPTVQVLQQTAVHSQHLELPR